MLAVRWQSHTSTVTATIVFLFPILCFHACRLSLMQLPSIFYDRNNFDWTGALFTMERTVRQNCRE